MVLNTAIREAVDANIQFCSGLLTEEFETTWTMGTLLYTLSTNGRCGGIVLDAVELYNIIPRWVHTYI